MLELNASDDRGIEVVRGRIKAFAQKKVTLPPGRHKIVVLDEADSMTAGAQQARTLFALLAALGRPISDARWQSLLVAPFGGDDSGLNVAWQRRVDEATGDSLLGEVVLLAAVGAGESADGVLKLGDALRIISALRVVGLERDARLLAIETAVSSGL